MISSLCCDIQDILLHAFRTVFRAVQAIHVHKAVVQPDIHILFLFIVHCLLKRFDNMHTALHDLPSVLRDQAVVKCNPVIDRTFDCIFDINCHMSCIQADSKPAISVGSALSQ